MSHARFGIPGAPQMPDPLQPGELGNAESLVQEHESPTLLPEAVEDVEEEQPTTTARATARANDVGELMVGLY